MTEVLVNCLFLDFAFQIIGFVLAYSFQTEKFYDLFGSLTYLALVQISLRTNPLVNDRQVTLSTLASVWAVRLGFFLVCRVLMTGGDARFDKVKTKPVIYLIYWLIQGVWVFITLLPILLVNRTTRNNVFGVRDYVGVSIWVIGFAFEVIADYQKFNFKMEPSSQGTFISHGLWSLSRHPNYFGEICLWFGCFVIASSSLQGWEWVSAISPLFVYYLLNNVSGIPILERNGMKKFGHLETYQHYCKTVPVLVPFFGRTN